VRELYTGDGAEVIGGFGWIGLDGWMDLCRTNTYSAS